MNFIRSLLRPIKTEHISSKNYPVTHIANKNISLLKSRLFNFLLLPSASCCKFSLFKEDVVELRFLFCDFTFGKSMVSSVKQQTHFVSEGNWCTWMELIIFFLHHFKKLHLKEFRFSFYKVSMKRGWWEITAFLGFQMKKLRTILNSKPHTYIRM